jgi:5-methylcytosine-specific restriction endonuclease McrA
MEDLEGFLFRSTILMLVRRLIWNAAWYEERYPGDRIAVIETFERDYLLGNFGFNRRERRELSKLVFDSLDASRRKIPKGVEQKLLNSAKENQQRCQLCGRNIDYSIDRNDELSYSLDHIWPQSLGGESEEWNLQVTHKRCNSKRQDIADVSDAHYEHFHVKHNWSSDERDSFWKELNWQFRIAAAMKADFTCEICKNPEQIDESDGELYFSLMNRDENFNIFNIQVTCYEHLRLPRP